jgi:hypothetical protein
MLTQQTELGAVSATTDAGRVLFASAPPAPRLYGDLRRRRRKAPSVVTLANGNDRAQRHDTTATLPTWSSTWVVWVTAGDAAAIQHTLEWNNGGDTAYIGDQTSPDGSPIVTQVSLEPGAANPQFLGIYLDTPGQIRGSTYVNPAPLVPGTSSATLRYTVPNLTSLTLPVTLPTSSLQPYVPVDVTITEQLSAGQITEKVDYQVFTAALKSGTRSRFRSRSSAAGTAARAVIVGQSSRPP